MPAAMVVLVDRSLSCSLAVTNVVAEVVVVVVFARNSHCMEEVGLGWLEGEAGSSALQRSSRLLPFLRLCGGGGGGGVCKGCARQQMDERCIMKECYDSTGEMYS